MSVAKRLCPHAIVVPGRMRRYSEVSDQVFEIFERFSPTIEPLSIDEAFLDLEGTQRAMGQPEDVAQRLKMTIFGELGITASVGLAPNKFLAKLASDMKKPDGLTIIREEDIEQILPPLPVTKIWGIGKRTAQRLDEMAIRTIADLRRASDSTLERLLGSDAERCKRLAFGIDAREVIPDSRAKSIGHERTFRIDVPDPEELRSVLLAQVEQVGSRLRRHKLRARTVTLKLRYGDFKTITRAHTLDDASDRTDEIWHAAKDLFDTWAGKDFQPVRLIGISAGGLVDEQGQMNLFNDPKDARRRALDAAVDGINARFGHLTLRRGGGRE
jgi:DNA polymerase-4